MTRSSRPEKAQRLNAAFQLLAGGHNLVDAAEKLTDRFGLSRRQAYRYLQQAQLMRSPIAVGEPTIPITIKVPADVVAKLRSYAQSSGLTIGETVARAVRAFLIKVARRG
jgi:predicted DNA-binding transcriptional regulator YafY